jgi:hypothetical protein
VDETVVFHALDKAELVRIVDIQLDRQRRRLLEKRIELEVTEAAKRFLLEAGYDPVYGARPIKRTIQRSLESEIARRLLAGAIEEGRKLTIDLSGGGLTFTAARPAMAMASLEKQGQKNIPGRRCGGHLPGLASRLGSDANAFSVRSRSKVCAIRHTEDLIFWIEVLTGEAPDAEHEDDSKMKSIGRESVFKNEMRFHNRER